MFFAYFYMIFFNYSFLFASERYYTNKVSNSNYISTVNVPIQSFKRIYANLGNVYLDSSKAESSLDIIGPENIINAISVFNLSDTLYIIPKDPKIKYVFTDSLLVTVGIGNKNLLSLGGDATYFFSNIYKGDFLKLQIFGSARCQITCNLKQLELEAKQDAAVECSGSADSYEIVTSGNGTCNISGLKGVLTYCSTENKLEKNKN